MGGEGSGCFGFLRLFGGSSLKSASRASSLGIARFRVSVEEEVMNDMLLLYVSSERFRESSSPTGEVGE